MTTLLAYGPETLSILSVVSLLEIVGPILTDDGVAFAVAGDMTLKEGCGPETDPDEDL